MYLQISLLRKSEEKKSTSVHLLSWLVNKSCAFSVKIMSFGELVMGFFVFNSDKLIVCFWSWVYRPVGK